MKYKFEDIAINSTAKKLPEPSDNEHYIGLEHLDSSNLYVTRWGAETAPIGEKLLMKKGDVLFGKRRAYQKKVGVAPFDGIFSAHGMVLRPKEDVICKSFFPFFISSDYFLNEAIRISVGGLSPTINWKDLRVLEFELPSLEEQRVLADKLWAAYEVKESYKNLLTQTDKLLHAQFYKMFGDETQYRKIADVFTLQMGKTPSRDIPTYFGDEGHTWLSIADMKEDAIFTSASKEKLTDLAIKDCGIKIVPCNTVIMSFKLTVGRLAITNEDLYTNEAIMAFLPKDNSYRTKFVYYLFQHIQWLGDAKLAVKGNTLNKESISNILLPIIGIERQDDFLHIAEQAEQTKATLNKGIAAIEAVIRSLIAEGTTKI